MLAADFLASLQIAMRMWIEEDLAREPAAVIDEVLDEMGQGGSCEGGPPALPTTQRLASTSRRVSPGRPGRDWHNDSTLVRTKPSR